MQSDTDTCVNCGTFALGTFGLSTRPCQNTAAICRSQQAMTGRTCAYGTNTDLTVIMAINAQTVPTYAARGHAGNMGCML